MMILQTYQKRIAVFVMVIAMSFGFFAAPVAQAEAEELPVLQKEYSFTNFQSDEDYRALVINLIRQLLAQIAALQASSGNTDNVGGPAQFGLAVGDTVETTDKLSIRLTPAGTLLDVVDKGIQGKITTGPRFVEGRTWWGVEFYRPMSNQSFTSGWVAGDWLNRIDNGAQEDDDKDDPKDDDKDDPSQPVRVQINNINEKVFTPHPHVRFEIEFEVEALTDDVYVLAALSAKDGALQPIVRAGRNSKAEGDMTFALSSSADRDGSFYEVREGDVEDFELVVSFNPKASGFYSMELPKLPYTLGKAGGNVQVIALDGAKTDLAYVEVVTAADEDEDDATRELQPIINELEAQIKLQGREPVAPSKTAREAMSVSELQSIIASLQAQVASNQEEDEDDDMVEEVVVAPEKNHFACNRSEGRGSLDNTEVACYGVWDYGNSFGGDQHMCGQYSRYELGCTIEVPVCESGVAQATRYYSNRQLGSVSSSNIAVIANNLQTTPEVVREEMAGMWEYTCVADSSDEMTGDFWDLDDTFAYVVGVYEGSYPDGVSHSGGFHPQGEVTLTMNRSAGQYEDTMLVLTSYEPVKWKLEGDAAGYVTRVFLSGYYDQEIVGIDDDVEVIYQTYESGSREYFYFYEKDSRDAKELIDYLEEVSGDRNLYPYYGAYSADTINLGLKG
jgi:hypothetical protein